MVQSEVDVAGVLESADRGQKIETVEDEKINRLELDE
jgi:hypothetical protein